MRIGWSPSTGSPAKKADKLQALYGKFPEGS